MQLYQYLLINCKTGKVMTYSTGYINVHNAIVSILKSGRKHFWHSFNRWESFYHKP